MPNGRVNGDAFFAQRAVARFVGVSFKNRKRGERRANAFGVYAVGLAVHHDARGDNIPASLFYALNHLFNGSSGYRGVFDYQDVFTLNERIVPAREDVVIVWRFF